MSNFYQENIDVSKVDNLIKGTLIPSLTIARKVVGNGVLKRGTLLTTDDGIEYKVFDQSSDDAVSCVLVNDIDLDDPDQDTEVAVYHNGEFNQNVIEEVMGIELTPKTIEKARAMQFIIAPMHEYPEAY